MRLLLLLILVFFQFQAIGQDEPTEQEPIDGWAIKEYKSKKELKEMRQEKWKELRVWEDEHFVTPKGKLYFGLRGGYTFPYLTIFNRSPEAYLGTSDLFIGVDGDLLNRGIYNANAGGFRIGANIGYMFNQYIGFEADLGYNRYKDIVLGRNNTPNYKSELVTYSQDLSFWPQVVFVTPNIRNFYFYAKVGMFIPFWGGTEGDAFVQDTEGTFLKELLGSPTSGVLTIADIVAEALGENIDGLGFLEDGVLNALGYRVDLDAHVDITLRPALDAVGFTATLGGRYQITPVISLMAEFRVAGYNISTLQTVITDLDLRAQLLGDPEFILLTENGGTVQGQPVDAEILEFLITTDYVYELTETSNNAQTNPDGVDPTKPAEELATRNSANGFTMSMGLQFNFGDWTKKLKEKRAAK